VASPTNSGLIDLPRRAALTLVIAGALALAGCGGSGGSLAAATPASTAPAPATAAPASASTTAASQAGCGGDVAALVTKHLARADVVSVTIIGGCHQASIATSLAATEVAGGLAICDGAAEVAYTDGVSSISVSAADGKELAIGLKDAPCIGEP
jgi:hypothetical protein